MITEEKRGNFLGWICVFLGHNAAYGDYSDGKTIFYWWHCFFCGESLKMETPDHLEQYLLEITR